MYERDWINSVVVLECLIVGGKNVLLGFLFKSYVKGLLMVTNPKRIINELVVSLNSMDYSTVFQIIVHGLQTHCFNALINQLCFTSPNKRHRGPFHQHGTGSVPVHAPICSIFNKT